MKNKNIRKYKKINEYLNKSFINMQNQNEILTVKSISDYKVHIGIRYKNFKIVDTEFNSFFLSKKDFLKNIDIGMFIMITNIDDIIKNI